MSRNGAVRIVYCDSNVDGTVGGSHYSLLYLVKGLDRTRFHPIVVFYNDHSLLPAYRDAGIETLVWRRDAFTFAARLGRPLRWFRPPVLALQRLLNGLRFGWSILARAWFLVTRRISIVHLNNSILRHHDWMFAAMLTRKRCLTHERGINQRYSGMAKYVGKRLDAVICISSAVRACLRDHGADFGNLVTIPNGLDPNLMRIRTPAAQLRVAYGLGANGAVIGMTGNIKAWKGQDTLIRAVDIVRRVCPSIRCLLVGDTAVADREYDRTIRALVASLGLQEHVVFTGFQPHVADFLMLCDVVIHASVLPEPFGRVILEAMACRKPIVASRAGAIPEIIEEGETGLTFPPGDSQQLADAIIRLITNREEARRLGENGYDRLVRRFHIQRNIDSTVALYDRLLGGTN